LLFVALHVNHNCKHLPATGRVARPALGVSGGDGGDARRKGKRRDAAAVEGGSDEAQRRAGGTTRRRGTTASLSGGGGAELEMEGCRGAATPIAGYRKRSGG
jgi:hypothetical protein